MPYLVREERKRITLLRLTFKPVPFLEPNRRGWGGPAQTTFPPAVFKSFVFTSSSKLKSVSVAQDPRGQSEKGLECARSKFPGEEEAGGGGPTVVTAVVPLDHPPQEILRHVGPPERGWMGTTPGPVDPRETPISKEGSRSYRQHSGEIVLVHVACRPAELLELGVVDAVLHNAHGKPPVDLEPLGPLPPLSEVHLRAHAGVIPAPTIRPGVIKCPHKAIA